MSKKSIAAKHPNSKVVYIYRKRSFIQDAQKEAAAEFVAMSKKPIGSYWDSHTSKAVATGLTFDEQKLLMPILVDCEPTDRQFRDKVKDFFCNMKTAVDYEKGAQYEIGLEKDNTKPVSENNMPLDLASYVAFRHDSGHPHVAPSKAAGDGDQTYEYYVFDPSVSETAQLQNVQDSDAALELYLKVKKDAEKVDMLLTLMKIDPRTITGNNVKELRAERLKKLVLGEPGKFVELVNLKNFDSQYLLSALTMYNILTRVGLKYVNAETKDTLGHNEDEAIAWLKDPKNSEGVFILKAKLEEAKDRPAKPVAQRPGSAVK